MDKSMHRGEKKADIVRAAVQNVSINGSLC